MSIQIKIADRANNVKPSPTLAVSAKAQELKSQGIDIIDLGVGEPDFDTPEHIKVQAIAAIKEGKTKYTAIAGVPELKKAIVNKFATENNLSYTQAQILVSCGAKHSIYNLTQALLDADDEVIIPAPYWVSYSDISILAEAKPVIVNCDMQQRFKITPQQLEKSITNKTKLLMLCSPSNPTGVCYTKAELQALGAVLKKHPNIFIMSDDIYEHITWHNEKFTNILNACPELYDRTIVINGVSKAYAMTGWRIGYAAGPEPIIKAMTKIQGQSTSNACSISQAAAIAALNGGLACVGDMVSAFKERHSFIVEALNKIPGIECIHGDGAFYVFPKVTKLIQMLANSNKSALAATGTSTASSASTASSVPNTASANRITNDTELTEKLLLDAKIAFVPGSAFGAEGYLRLSFATSMENLKEAVARLTNFVQQNT